MELTAGARQLLQLVRHTEPLTRAGVGELTGWARVTVNARIDELLASGLLREAGAVGGARGRPATRFAFEAGRGHLLVADVGASSARLARCDLSGEVLETTEVRLQIGDGPDAVLGLVGDGLEALLDGGPAWGLGISLPGPIEHATGRVVNPPIMTGWDGLVVPDVLGPRFGCPVLVENDVNAMAWGEFRYGPRRPVALGIAPESADDDPGRDLLFVKVGTGLGVGIVANGGIVHGSDGAAGDLGHTWADVSDVRTDRPLCRCGKQGCVEAYVGGWAIARDLATDGTGARTVEDVVRLVHEGNPHAVRRVRDAGRVLGASVAQVVSLLNPRQIVVGGQIAVAGEHLLAGVREHVAARSLPLATRRLVVRISDLLPDAGVLGLAAAVADRVLDPAG